MFLDMTLDWLSNMIAIINVGVINRDQYVRVSRSMLNLKVLDVLYSQGVINYFFVQEEFVVVGLKYYKNKCVLERLERVSKPSRKIYLSARNLDRFYRRNSFNGFYVLSTCCGLISSNQTILMSEESGLSGLVLLKVKLT